MSSSHALRQTAVSSAVSTWQLLHGLNLWPPEQGSSNFLTAPAADTLAMAPAHQAWLYREVCSVSQEAPAAAAALAIAKLAAQGTQQLLRCQHWLLRVQGMVHCCSVSQS